MTHAARAPLSPDAPASVSDAGGAVALLADKGRLEAALITAREAARLTFVRGDGVPQKAAPGRFYFLGGHGLSGPDALAPFTEAVRTLASRLDLARLHGHLHARSGLAPLRVADVVAGASELGLLEAADACAPYAVAMAVFGDGLHLKLRDGLVHLEPPEAIAVALARQAELAALSARVEGVVPALAARLRPDPTRSDLDPATAEALVHVAALGRESPHADFASAVLTRLQGLSNADGTPLPLPPSCTPGSSPRPLARQLEDLLVAACLLPAHPNLAALRAGLPVTFTAAEEAAAQAACDAAPAASLPDLTHLAAYAIDDAETTEVDDAVALDPANPRRVHVLIADVAAFVAPGSPLDATAQARLTTLYLPDGRIPMLPQVLGEGPASLVAHAARTALVISADVAVDGVVSHVSLQRARVRVAAQLTYDAVEGLLAEASTSDPVSGALTALEALADAHRAARHQRGAVTFQRPEVNFVAAPDGHIALKLGAPLSRARQLVAELMVLGCAAAADFAARHQLPMPFRGQPAPDGLDRGRQVDLGVDPKTGRVDDPVAQSELMRRLKPSSLTPDPRPHWTLGVPAYVQLTSPIRRYADLLAHQQLAHFLVTGTGCFSRADLEVRIGHMGRAMAPVRRADQEARRLFLLRWLAQEEGRVLDAVVLRELAKRHLVDISLLGLQEAVQLRGKRRPGAQVRLRVEAVDFDEDTVTFREV
jgi:hypothetical protein